MLYSEQGHLLLGFNDVARLDSDDELFMRDVFVGLVFVGDVVDCCIHV